MNDAIPVAACGIIYKRDDTSETANEAHADIQKVAGKDDTFHFNTMFPTK